MDLRGVEPLTSPRARECKGDSDDEERFAFCASSVLKAQLWRATISHLIGRAAQEIVATGRFLDVELTRIRPALAGLLLVGLTACGGQSAAAPELPPRPNRDAAAPLAQSEDGGENSNSPSKGKDEGGGQDSSAPAAKFTQDDYKTFAYATADSAALASEMAAVAGTVEQLYAHAAARDLASAEADAQALLAQADRLESDASTAAARLVDLAPTDGTLKDARAKGIDAFSLTAEDAGAVIDVAAAAASLDPQALKAVAGQVTALQGTSASLTSSYEALAKNLEKWASANPQAAAAAIAKY